MRNGVRRDIGGWLILYILFVLVFLLVCGVQPGVIFLLPLLQPLTYLRSDGIRVGACNIVYIQFSERVYMVVNTKTYLLARCYVTLAKLNSYPRGYLPSEC